MSFDYSLSDWHDCYSEDEIKTIWTDCFLSKHYVPNKIKFVKNLIDYYDSVKDILAEFFPVQFKEVRKYVLYMSFNDRFKLKWSFKPYRITNLVYQAYIDPVTMNPFSKLCVELDSYHFVYIVETLGTQYKLMNIKEYYWLPEELLEFIDNFLRFVK